MIKNFVPIIIPLLLAASFWQIFIKPDNIYWAGAVAVILIFSAGRILAGKYFFQFFRSWVNLSLVYVAQILFSILLISDVLRNWLVVVWVIFWAIILWLLKNYFQKLKNINDLDYLAFNRFFYYLGFWLLASSLYYLIIFINFSLIYSLVILFVASYLWGRELMILAEEKINRYFIWLVLFTSLQIWLALYLMPISFLVAGAIATLWFFFIMDFTISQEKNFRRYLTLFLTSVLILLISSII